MFCLHSSPSRNVRPVWVLYVYIYIYIYIHPSGSYISGRGGFVFQNEPLDGVVVVVVVVVGAAAVVIVVVNIVVVVFHSPSRRAYFHRQATGELSRVRELKAACPEGFLFYSGDDATGVSALLKWKDAFDVTV